MPQKHIETQAEWEQAMARRAMELARSELYLQLRYMNAALGALALTPDTDPARGLATNGAALVYGPAWVLRIYRQNRPYLLRGYLHSVLHCVFRHPWLRGRRDPALWGLACDIAAEYALDHLGAAALQRPVGWLRQKTYAELHETARLPAAGPIYSALCARSADELEGLQREFYCDSHRLWPADPQAPAAQMMGRQWEQLGRQTQLSMQQAGRQAGETAGAQALAAQVEAARSRRSYRDFLRRFTVMREEPRLDPDEFDLGTYTYGLRTYGNLPLIEPLETRESRKIRDLVIVIDTSESTAGALVKAFLRETFGILRTSGRFFDRCNVAVMQCDDAVRELTFLHSAEEWERYAAALTLHGGGGTDFRPAFARIAELQKEGTLRELQGILYFTDGKGTYPARPPACQTAFLFVEDGAEPPPSPPWAIRLTLSEQEFLPQPPAAPAIDWQEWDPEELPQL